LSVRPDRSWLYLAVAVTLVLTACGGGAAAPTPTGVAPGPSAAVPAPSPQRPALASPPASPSAIASSATATPGATQTAGETYEVQSGDTLLSIAQQYYGDVTLWRQIYDANKDTIGSDPDKLQVGMKLTIPPKQS
jgi:nucleoid-associated protein YgaU